MSTKVKIVGGAELQRNLDALSNRLSRQKRQTLVDAAEPIRTAMAQMAPRAPGAPDIASNIVVSATEQAGISIGPAKGFYYGFFLEYGTVKMRARPFLRPAFDRHVASGLTVKGMMGSIWRALIGRGASGGGTGL